MPWLKVRGKTDQILALSLSAPSSRQSQDQHVSPFPLRNPRFQS